MLRFTSQIPAYMKIHQHLIPVALATGILFSSCATSNVQQTEMQKTEASKSKETSSSVFVQLKDGSIKNYQSLKLVKGVFTTPHLLADGKIKIEASELIAYQNQDHYAISQSLITNGRKSFVAIETLPGFAVRIAKGKLNIYCKKFYNGRAAVDEYFIQEGSNGNIVAYSPELMKNLIKESDEAMNFFSKLKMKDRDMARKLQTTAELYNNTQLMTKY